jgi:hypothetical protein
MAARIPLTPTVIGPIDQGHLQRNSDYRRRATRMRDLDFLLHGVEELCELPRYRDHDRQIGRTGSERTPCAPWMSTPSISAVAEGPV